MNHAAKKSWGLPLAAPALVAAALASCVASAQQIRPGDERPELPPFEPPEPERGTILPPLPRQPDTERLEAGIRAYIREIRISGNTALPEEELLAIAEPYTNRELSFVEIEELRDRVSFAYIDRGYVTSGAEIPPQSLSDGVLELRIVEGSLDDIEVETDGRFRESYLKKRIRLGAATPVNVHEVEKRLQILQLDERIRTVDAALVPGERRGESLLRVRIAETPPYQIGAEGNNYESPAIGAESGVVRLEYLNITGFGDSLSARYTGSLGLNKVDAHYEVPLNAYDMTLRLQMQRTWSDVIEDPFDAFDIGSNTETYGITLRYPGYRSLNALLDVYVRGEWRRSQSFLLGDPFTFPGTGAHNGEATVAVLRFGQEWFYRSRRRAAAARSMLSVGIDALGATINPGDVPDGRFVAWLGQVQLAERFPFLDIELVARADVQLASSPLLSLERFAIGGHATVRGYRENTLVRDNGFIGSLEARLPVWRQVEGAFHVELAPFVDAGHSWNTNRTEIGPTTLVSVGIGARLAYTHRARFDVYWGHRIKDVDYGDRDWNLQDAGIHLALTVRFP